MSLDDPNFGGPLSDEQWEVAAPCGEPDDHDSPPWETRKLRHLNIPKRHKHHDGLWSPKTAKRAARDHLAKKAARSQRQHLRRIKSAARIRAERLCGRRRGT